MDRSGKNTLEPNNEEATLISVDASHAALRDKIQKKITEINELKDITQNQLKNISELQKKCEESYIGIQQIPQNKAVASDKFDEAMKQARALQTKQIRINELLNVSMKQFDDVLSLVNKSKEQFQSEEELANQRLLVYNADLKKIEQLSSNLLNDLQNSVSSLSSDHAIVKNFIDSKPEEQLKSQLVHIKSNITAIGGENEELCKDISEVEEKIKTWLDNTSTIENEMKEKLNNSQEVLKFTLERRLVAETSLKNLEVEMNNLEQKINELQQKCSSTHDKLLQETEKFGVIQKEIGQKKESILNKTKELEDSKRSCVHLQEDLKKVQCSEQDISATNEHLSQLNSEKLQLEQRRNEISEKINKAYTLVSNLEKGINDKLEKKEELKKKISFMKSCSQQLEENYRYEKAAFDKIVSEVKEKIEKLKVIKKERETIISEKRAEHKEYKEKIENIHKKQNDLKVYLTELKDKNSSRREELTNTLNEVKHKVTDIKSRVELKKDELRKKTEQKESIKALKEKISQQKEEYQTLLENFEKEKQDLEQSFNDKLEVQVKELQKVKLEKESELERVKDSTSKAEFNYFRLKSNVQTLKGELSCINQTLKRYSCEYEMLKMLLNWLRESQGSASSSDQGKPKALFQGPHSKPITQQSEIGDSPDEGELTTQEYHRSVTSETPNQEKSRPSSKNEQKISQVAPEESEIKIKTEEDEPINNETEPFAQPSDASPKKIIEGNKSSKINLLKRKTIKDVIDISSESDTDRIKSSQKANTLRNKEIHAKDSVMKAPAAPTRKYMRSTVSNKIERHQPVQPLNKKLKRPKGKTILDLVLEDTDSQSNVSN